MAGKSRSRRRISSGDGIVDWIFSRIIHALNHDIEEIHLKSVLYERHGGKTFSFYGYIDDGVIFLSAAKARHADRRAIAKTLLHEVMHHVFYGVRERHILRFEDLVWEKLSEAQIEMLEFFVPKRIER